MLALVVARDVGEIARNIDIFALLTPLIILGELVPIRVPRDDDEEELTVSTTFAFALLLIAGPVSALLAMAAASAVSDSARRRPVTRAAFNVAQYSLSFAAAAIVLHVTGLESLHHKLVAPSMFVPIVAAAGTFFVVNNTLAGVAVALSRRVRGRAIVDFLTADLAFQAGTAAVLMSMAPLVAAAAYNSHSLVLLIVCPLAAVYKSADTLARTSHEALHDSLTGLANRSYLRRTLDSLMHPSALSEHPVAFLMLDLDRFKDVNDTLGHHIGDELLQAMALRLRSMLRGHDFAARLGGDEFGIVLTDADETAAHALTQRIHAELETPVTLGTLTLDIATSVGVAFAPLHARDPDGLLRAADAALYQAKSARAGIHVYDPALNHGAVHRRPLLPDLHHAVNAGQFVVHYQLKADAHTRRLVGTEALLRWQHPRYGLVRPDEFIELLEHSGLIRHVTVDIVDQALDQIERWADLGVQLNVAVNLSPRNLHDPRFVPMIAERLAGTRLAASSLQFEVTERTVMTDPRRVTETLDRLKAIGVSLALDDFGTGYSSLAHLSRLPLDELKIDKSFVQNMTTSPKDAVIVRSTIELARSLGLRTVAEGVEDELTWNELHALGCDVIQGYIVSRPKSSTELTALLQRLKGDASQASCVHGRAVSAER